MKIQIVNLVPLKYPYQVTRIKKQWSQMHLDYSIQMNYIFEESDVYILIVEHQDVRQWINAMKINPSKVILISPKLISDYPCWVIPKAFEKEFDVEKCIMYLSCLLKHNPEMNLFQSVELKTGKIQRDGSLKVNVDSYVKKDTEVHLFVKDKVERVLQIETHRKEFPVFQHWIKAAEPEIEVLTVKRKS